MKKIVWAIRYRRAVKSADKLAHYTHSNQYVFLYGGKLLVMSKRDIEAAIARGIFRRGITAGTVRKMAIYSAR